MAASAEPDPYLALGVERNATFAQIRAAYLALAAQYHPDRHAGNPLAPLASARMAEINRAYQRLSDPARRAAFDRGGAASGGPGPTAGRGSTAPSPSAAPSGGSGAGGAVAGRPFMRTLAWIVAVPLVLRYGMLLVRGLAALARAAVRGLSLLRGTPAGAAAALVAALILIGAALVRRRRRRQTPPPPRHQ
jgi:curved DNA-binding protein CbpA